jgi:digalactosyldiacylglycerol synthase
MTNYGHYIRHAGVPGAERLARLATRWHRRLIRSHVDIVVPLSPAVADVTQGHPGLTEARVTGVLEAYAGVPPVTPETQGAYFLGRLVWDKGLAEVIALAARTGVPIDILGDGPDGPAIRAHARAAGAPVRFLGPSAAPWAVLGDHRVFVNPSVSEVLCTATADALVAGRHVVLADCPANAPFAGYPNVHPVSDLDGAAAALRRAMRTPPAPPDAVRRDFDWTRACLRLAALAGLGGAPAASVPADDPEAPGEYPVR